MVLAYYKLENIKKVYDLSKYLTVDDIINAKIQEVCLQVFKVFNDTVSINQLLLTNQCSPLVTADYYYSEKQYKKALYFYRQLKEIPEDNASAILNYLDSLYRIENKIDFRYLYCTSFKDNNTDELTISIHPKAKKFLFYKHNFSTDVLFLSHKLFAHFFLIDPENGCKYILSLLNKKYNKITIFGSSKAGTGAITLGYYLSIFTTAQINCIAYSPQTNLKKPNHIYIKGLPSYKQLNRLAEKYEFINFYKELNGDLYDFLYTKIKTSFIVKGACFLNISLKKFLPKNLIIQIIYGQDHVSDCLEAMRLKKFVTLIPIIGFPYHNILLFLSNQTIENKYQGLHFIADDDDERALSIKQISFDEFLLVHQKYFPLRNKFIPNVIF